MRLKSIKIGEDLHGWLKAISGKGETFDGVIRALARNAGAEPPEAELTPEKMAGLGPNQLIVLQAIREEGGAATAEQVIEKLKSHPAFQEAAGRYGNGAYKWKSRIYTTRVRLTHLGLVSVEARGVWALTEAGELALVNAEALKGEPRA